MRGKHALRGARGGTYAAATVMGSRSLLFSSLVLAACEGGGQGSSGTSSSGEVEATSGSSSGAGSTTGGSSSSGDPTGEVVDFEACMSAVPGLVAEEVASKVDGYRFFSMTFPQPVDHNDPEGPSFSQRLTLLHRDPAAPLVLATDGYGINAASQTLSEPALLLHGNQLRIEHRMFTGSAYDDPDWSTVTIEQAAADHHRIAELIGGCYTGARLATGASKGGMTAIYFRRYYPDDVDVTLPYVAPHSYGTTDPRYIDFVAGVGDPACRAALDEAQRELLVRRGPMLALMQAQAQQDGYTYDVLGEDFVLEVMALEMPFTFWQYFDASLCPDIPGAAASDAELWAFYDEILPAWANADDRLGFFEPYFWQAATQLGGPGIDESKVADLLMFPGRDVPASFVFTPTADPVFDPEKMPDIAAWLAAEGARILFVYGENDPWSAGAFEVAEGPEVLKLVAPAGNHGSKIEDLTPSDRQLAYTKLEAWTGVTPMPRSLPRDPPLRELLGLAR